MRSDPVLTSLHTDVETEPQEGKGGEINSQMIYWRGEWKIEGKQKLQVTHSPAALQHFSLPQVFFGWSRTSNPAAELREPSL